MIEVLQGRMDLGQSIPHTVTGQQITLSMGIIWGFVFSSGKLMQSLECSHLTFMACWVGSGFGWQALSSSRKWKLHSYSVEPHQWLLGNILWAWYIYTFSFIELITLDGCSVTYSAKVVAMKLISLKQQLATWWASSFVMSAYRFMLNEKSQQVHAPYNLWHAAKTGQQALWSIT